MSRAIEILETSDAFGFLGLALVERARTQILLGKRDLAFADLAQARQVARMHDVERVSLRADLLEARIGAQEKDLEKADRFLEAALSVSGMGNLRGRIVFPESMNISWWSDFVFCWPGSGSGRPQGWPGGPCEAPLGGKRAQRGRIPRVAGRGMERFVPAGKGPCRPGTGAAPFPGDGVVRPFVNAGRELIPYLRQLKSREGYRTAAAAILSALEDHGDPVVEEKIPGGISESFHHREVQILELVSQGLRNREIGKHLFLSEETVKWYMKRLFCKLAVRTRTEAAASARKLGLLA